MSCAAGESSPEGATGCSKCERGKAKPAGPGECASCEPGRFANKKGAGECKLTTTKVLFGDLVAAVEYATDHEKLEPGETPGPTPDFKPGTNAQRHSLDRAKHGSKHGSAHASVRFSIRNMFASSRSSQSSGSGSVDAPAPAEPSDRPRLARSLTWRATPPALPKEPSSSQV